MADILIAAGPEDASQARGLAEALGVLGHKAAPFPENEGAGAAVDAAKCVLALWSRHPAPAGMIAATALALDRKKLVSAELDREATPAPLKAAPKTDLSIRDRSKFKARFEALVAELQKLAPVEAATTAMPEALTKARAALLAQPETRTPWRAIGGLTLGVALLFAVGFGAGRVMNAVRSGDFRFPTPTTSEAQATSAPSEAPANELTWAQLERDPWRTSAAKVEASADLSARARGGDAKALALVCLGHLAGVEGFLPSPTAAREACDASAAQHEPAGLYLSWVLRRTAPHAGLDEATARARLTEAAELGWTAAQIDLGSVLEPSNPAEAGRLWLAAAEAGDARGQFQYARWLRDSRAGPRDPTQAIPFLQRAADQGHAEAQHVLATLYRDGIGVQANAARARALYEQAARQNHTPAMFNLADLIRNGTEADRAEAVRLYHQLSCMPDERQIQPMASRRLRALGESVACP